MQLIFDEERVRRTVSAPVLNLFSEEVLSFLQELSERLRTHGREYPDVMALAFWCRRAALVKARERYSYVEERQGRGVAFHIAPGNVPLLFAYSLAAGLLAGNKNIIRLSAREYPQTNLVMDMIARLIEEKYSELKDYVYLLQYGHDDEITAGLSSIADIRVIWGGDRTVARIREIPVKPGLKDICFGDRCGICVISAEDYMQEENKDLLIRRFFNDTYVFDQNACTSPVAVIWLGNDADAAAKDFRIRLGKMADEEYFIRPAQITGKLAAFLEAAAAMSLRLVTSVHAPKLFVAGVSRIDGKLLEYKYHSGYFYEYKADNLKDILPLCTEHLGTITYFGGIADQLRKTLDESSCGDDKRIVPVGTAMDFSLIWDGYDLITEMSDRTYL